MGNGLVKLSRSGHVPYAVVFVHGWGGDSEATWDRFPDALARMEGAGKLDAFFLHYPSMTHTMPFCASKLRQFFADVAREPVQCLLRDSLPSGAMARGANAKYERILVVAHSMGAVIARRALLDLPANGVQSDAFRLLFFAPAHCGSNLALLIGSGFGLDRIGFAKVVGEAARMLLPSLRDLEVGSAALRKMSVDVMRAHQSRDGGVEHLRAAVYHAQNDKVVEQDDFEGDPPFEPVMDKNHRSICKPSSEYAVPVDALKGLIAAALERLKFPASSGLD